MNRKHIILFLSVAILVTVLAVVGISLLTVPKQLKQPISKEEVFDIGKRYVEETYGTDYAPNGGVVEITFGNGTGRWTYPGASFRVPADWQQAGTIVSIMVNPETGEIFKVLTNWSRNMPPTQ